MRIVDLRSDTVTLPTEEMLEAIKTTELGDDVYREDPTVNRLEELAARKMGKEAALLTTNGTQANLVSLMSQTERGDEVIFEAHAHLYTHEVGAFSAIGGLVPRLVTGHMGVMTPQDIDAVLRGPNIHFPPTKLICIENTHNYAGGTVWSPSQIKALCDFAKARGLKVHMDGARIFNAAVAQNIDVRELTRYVDTLMFCLSKGLSAPVGSLVVGSRELVDEVKKSSPDVLALSALLTTVLHEMKNAVDAVGAAGIRGKLKILLGGNAVKKEFARQIGADSGAQDAVEGLDICKKWTHK